MIMCLDFSSLMPLKCPQKPAHNNQVTVTATATAGKKSPAQILKPPAPQHQEPDQENVAQKPQKPPFCHQVAAPKAPPSPLPSPPPPLPPPPPPTVAAPLPQGSLQPARSHDPYMSGTMAYVDQISRVRRVRSVELVRSRTLRINFGDEPYEHSTPSPPPSMPTQPPTPSAKNTIAPSPEAQLGADESPYQPPPRGHYPPLAGLFSDDNPNACIVM